MTKEYYDERLHRMLQYKRPHGTHMEIDWADIFIDPYKPILLGDSDVMAYVVQVPREDGSINPVLFSAHVDTVHRKEGKQKVLFDDKTKRYYKNDNEPLGADDGAGCWLLLEMIDAKIPGTYVFHRGEEQGGIGSSWMADTQQEWLSTFKYAIAFDRKATHSVISHQGWSRCCSDEFAEALSDALNDQDLEFMYTPDDGGVYTDTKEYIGLIPECTNVSCGYYSEHTGNEELDLHHLFALRDACVKLNWEALPAVRDPKKVEKLPMGTGFGFGTGKGSSRFSFVDDVPDDPYELLDMSYLEMAEYAENDPTSFAILVHDFVEQVGGFVKQRMQVEGRLQPLATEDDAYDLIDEIDEISELRRKSLI